MQNFHLMERFTALGGLFSLLYKWRKRDRDRDLVHSTTVAKRLINCLELLGVSPRKSTSLFFPFNAINPSIPFACICDLCSGWRLSSKFVPFLGDLKSELRRQKLNNPNFFFSLVRSVWIKKKTYFVQCNIYFEIYT